MTVGLPREVFFAFLKLGLTSFGGPVAHLGYFRHEIVERRGWVDDRTYSDLVALSQFLPGPSSSQVGMALGATRAGVKGAVAAWLGFTLPSALIMVLFALGVSQYSDSAVDSGWLNGLKIVAVAVVARAIWSMGRQLCPDWTRAAFALAATVVVLVWPGPLGQIAAILVGGAVGWLILDRRDRETPEPLQHGVSRRTAILCLILFAALLALLPVAAGVINGLPLALVDSFYRSGALVFGGGHVILPLLQAEVVPTGWIDRDVFLAGYGAAQALPGPLLSFSAYLGAMIDPRWMGVPIALLCLVAIFAPSFLLIIGMLPFWDNLRRFPAAQAAMAGINAAVVGLLLAALYDPVWISAIHKPQDFILAVTAYGTLAWLHMPPWLVVILCGIAGTFL